MRLSDTIEYVLIDFSTSRFKTIMSSLGIIIGVVAIVVMLSIGEGLYSGVSSEFGGMDLDVILVVPGEFGMQPTTRFEKPAELTERDVDELETAKGVKLVSPQTNKLMSIKFRDDLMASTVFAIDPNKEPKLSESLYSGRFLTQSDRSSCVIGYDIATKMFRIDLRPGIRLTLIDPLNDNFEVFTIVGVLDKQETTSFFSGNPDRQVYITHNSMNELSGDDSYSQIQVKVESISEVEATAVNIEKSLEKIHKKESFSVFKQKAFLEGVDRVLTMIRFALGGVGGVSLLVGGIGITNVMMLTVTERIKEIGIMKAIGATRSEVRSIFLLESSLLGIISGGIGVIVGVIVSEIIASAGTIPAKVGAPAILLGLMFGVLTTTIAGVYPATKAAGLDPIEALRTE